MLILPLSFNCSIPKVHPPTRLELQSLVNNAIMNFFSWCSSLICLNLEIFNYISLHRCKFEAGTCNIVAFTYNSIAFAYNITA